jgi:2-dehydro-3-deoxyphosphogluconate aldolase/(4S)-4-hydroxy-2-oxoglutarate aldolase
VTAGTERTADSRVATRERLEALGAIAVVRLRRTEMALRVVDALHAGGVYGLEITVTVPDALGVISAVAQRFGSTVCVGVGSVLDVDTARRAVDAGAEYVVSPVFKGDVVAAAHRMGVPALPGACTPTEALTAHEAGADIVKIFPADSLGPAFIKALLGPMPFLRLMPTGGVTPDNVGVWLAAGAVAVGLGGALVDPALVDAGAWDQITTRAKRVTEAVTQARSGRGR